MTDPRRMSFKPAPGPSVHDHLPDPPHDNRRGLAEVERHHQAAGEADPARARPRRGPGVGNYILTGPSHPQSKYLKRWR